MVFKSYCQLKYKFSYYSSRCLDPAVGIVTAVEPDGISYKLFYSRDYSLSGFG